jgi:hypothetical protein
MSQKLVNEILRVLEAPLAYIQPFNLPPYQLSRIEGGVPRLDQE